MNRPSDDEYGSLSDLLGYDDEAPDPADDAHAAPADDVAHDPAEGDADDAADGGANDAADDGGLPQGLPPEYAEAYRRGYERARRGEGAPDPVEEPTDPVGEPSAEGSAGRGQDPTLPEPPQQHGGPVDEPGVEEPAGRGDERSGRGEEPTLQEPEQEYAGPVDEPTVLLDPERAKSPADPAAPAAQERGTAQDIASGGSGWSSGSGDEEPTRHIPIQPRGADESTAPRPSYDEDSTRDDDERRKRLALVGLVAAGLVLVVAAFGIGKLFADNAADVEAGGGTSEGEPAGGNAQAARPYKGSVKAVTVAGATASCQSGSSVDSAGNPTSYEPSRALDSDHSTAWRCDGSGVGQRLTVSLPEWTPVAQVGLVPGYAKTDPVSGADRYAENNRITKVRWNFDDGTSFVQKLNGDAADRSMRTMRVPETSTSSLVIEILASNPGPRNTVAISEVRVAKPAG